MLAEALKIDDLGFVHVPERPGFGFVLDAERVKRHTSHTVEYGECGSAVAT